MRGLLGCLCAALLAASVTACAKRHDGGAVLRDFAPSYGFSPLAGWAHTTDGHEWTSTEGGARHILRVFPYPGNDVDAFAMEWERRSRARGYSVIDEGRLRVCEGGPARHWRVLPGRSEGRVETHYLVTMIRGGLGVAEYEHPASVPARRDALRVLATVCPGFATFPTFAGWKKPYRFLSIGDVQTSPDGRSTFVAHVATRRDPAWREVVTAAPPGRVVSERYEGCGATRVRRIESRRGGDTIETSIALVRPFGYRVVYTHPAAQAPLAEARRALTLMCRPPEVPTQP